MKKVTKVIVGAAVGAGALLQDPTVQDIVIRLLSGVFAKHAAIAAIAGIIAAAAIHDPKKAQ